jgi:hypothetical protein
VSSSAAATQKILKRQLEPREGDRHFSIAGVEDADGVNWTLRKNIADFGMDASRLAAIANPGAGTSDLLLRTQVEDLRLIARFYVFIATNWEVTDGTRQVFETTRNQIASSLPATNAKLKRSIASLEMEDLAERISPEGTLLGLDNRYLEKVDAEIDDPGVRRVIRGVQPACVKLGNGSGVNVSPHGQILTAAHVARALDEVLIAEFPSGRSYRARCTAIDTNFDLAICSIVTRERLPFARVADASPKQGTPVVCIGQPGKFTPAGKPTGYQPFHVSSGHIRGISDNPLGSQSLGRTKHDAWTYWGHSGSPLFDEAGRIVALHNSWDSDTAMRRAVTQQAIAKFLTDNKIVP